MKHILTVETCTLPVLTYGARTWALTKNNSPEGNVKKHSEYQKKKRKKIKIVMIRERKRTKMNDIGYTIKRVQVQLRGSHKARTEEGW